jgi:alkylation response protein AidB-like acyl-CoA dehydrogenase
MPAGAIRGAVQTDGSVIWYMHGDDIPQPPEQGEQPEPVPQSVTKRQLYRGLMQMGWLGTTMPQIDAAVNTLVNQMPELPREVARSDFFTSRDYLRNNPLLVSALMGPPLSKTAEQVDDFFRLCGSFAPEGDA